MSCDVTLSESAAPCATLACPGGLKGTFACLHRGLPACATQLPAFQRLQNRERGVRERVLRAFFAAWCVHGEPLTCQRQAVRREGKCWKPGWRESALALSATAVPAWIRADVTAAERERRRGAPADRERERGQAVCAERTSPALRGPQTCVSVVVACRRHDEACSDGEGLRELSLSLSLSLSLPAR